ncbi:MAG TPA: type II secretion system protein N [Rudaea sp.]
MRILRFVLILIVVLAVAAGLFAWTCPADFAYRHLAKKFGPVTLDGVDGTVWHGHAATVAVFGQPLGALDWELDPKPLLLRAETALTLHVAGGVVVADGKLLRTPDAKIRVSGTTIELPAQALAPAVDIPSLQLSGKVRIKIDQARLVGAWFDDVRGSARWEGAGVTGAAQADFGAIESTFLSAPNGAIGGVLHDSGGPLAADGMFSIVAGSYEAQARLSPRDGNAQVAEALRYVGQAQPDGSTLLLIRGRLFKLF